METMGSVLAKKILAMQKGDVEAEKEAEREMLEVQGRMVDDAAKQGIKLTFGGGDDEAK